MSNPLHDSVSVMVKLAFQEGFLAGREEALEPMSDRRTSIEAWESSVALACLRDDENHDEAKACE